MILVDGYWKIQLTCLIAIVVLIASIMFYNISAKNQEADPTSSTIRTALHQ